MQRLLNITLSLIVATLSIAAAESASAQSRPAVKVRTHVIEVNSIEVTKTKASGHAWDHNIFCEAPDLRVEVMRRDAAIERQIATLERQMELRRSQIMSQQFRKNSGAQSRRMADLMLANQFEFGSEDQFRALFGSAGEMSDELQEWTEAELNDPQLIKINEVLPELRDQIIRNTPVAENTFHAEYGVQFGEPTIDVAVGDTIKLIVWDEDIAVHDMIGQTTLRITKETIAIGRFDVQCGKVISLKFNIRPIE